MLQFFLCTPPTPIRASGSTSGAPGVGSGEITVVASSVNVSGDVFGGLGSAAGTSSVYVSGNGDTTGSAPSVDGGLVFWVFEDRVVLDTHIRTRLDVCTEICVSRSKDTAICISKVLPRTSEF